MVRRLQQVLDAHVARGVRNVGCMMIDDESRTALAGEIRPDPLQEDAYPQARLRQILKMDCRPRKPGWKAADLDLVEANEAFAAQACAVNKDMGWDPAKVNVNGGAIAIGHPIGASGARILTTLLFEMGKRDAKKGLATLCIGGGMGIALTVER